MCYWPKNCYNPFLFVARYLTTFTALISIVIAFVESQITFCLLNKSQIARKKSKCNRKNRRGQYVDNDQAADLEYVIPKVFNTKQKLTFKFETILKLKISLFSIFNAEI